VHSRALTDYHRRRDNPRRGFEMMKSARVRATLSMTLREIDDADERRFGE
jgi:hypothetical protein